MPNSEKIKKLKGILEPMQEEYRDIEEELLGKGHEIDEIQEEINRLEKLNAEEKEDITPSPGQLQLSVL